MKSLIKFIIIIAIIIAIFGATTTKQFMYNGIDKGVDTIENGMDYLGSSDHLKDIRLGFNGLMDFITN